MLITPQAASQLIADGRLLHIAGNEQLLRKLPKGRWIGGSTEYFIDESGGKESSELLFVTEFPYNFSIKEYGASELENIASDAYDSGFSIIIIPFDSGVHREYAQNASSYPGIFMKIIAGWIAGSSLSNGDQTPAAVNGLTGNVLTDKAVALHLEVDAEKVISINIINIFTQDEKSPVFEFKQEGFDIEKCLIDGKETLLADYLTQNNIDTKMPLVGDYSGTGVNISFKSVQNGVVHLYAPVFSGIKYRMAKNISDYEESFKKHLDGINKTDAVFSCNCILNFLYGDLKGKSIRSLAGPVTFGEIAYQLVNQTLVYVSVTG